jgi:uncharacterized membrane protein
MICVAKKAWGGIRRVVDARAAVIGFVARALGIGLAASGVAHFAAPRPFIALSKPFFPEETEKWVRLNGASETAVGLALLDRRTRTAGLVGLIVYGVYLADRAISLLLKQLGK